MNVRFPINPVRIRPSLSIAASLIATTVAVPAGAQAVGDVATFGARIQRVAYGPDRATYTLTRPAYVTLISVTDKAIQALIPVVGMKSQMEGSGDHVASMSRQTDSAGNRVADRFGSVKGGAEDITTVAQLADYNRCISAARAADARRREGTRRVVGRDSSGKPIYGPPEPSAADIGQDAESRCSVKQATGAQPAAPTGRAQKGRYLLLFASDTPIEFHDITDLVVSEGDIRSITKVVGDRLFGVRGANWSAHYLPW